MRKMMILMMSAITGVWAGLAFSPLIGAFVFSAFLTFAMIQIK